MYSVIKRYSLQLVFTLSLLVGLQLPSFLHQYETRLQGHFAEAQLQLAKFQSLADLYFEGDLGALIQQHRDSNENVFRDEAEVISANYQRVQTLKIQINELQQPLWHRLFRLTQQVNSPIIKQTWQNYQANIVLNQQAIIVGVSVAIILMLLLEVILTLIKYLISSLFIRTKQPVKN
ncbi:DUF2937 family protein [Psychromonas sp. 14N.309.X.WAT.B.A12]|uniref:DUF2937 family protein n=1 Tax=unclassified Psychromonas TaxID=2614957 RepID=UPI0025B1E0E9|nr:DUF2937 family protein [Psychromonas sp. 14N.309.X.WAT.B.A12]MDN2662467.1 DUF2937 family protein [Psychromonas sp. 14N.309.X.WAT.B.A12]